MTRELMEQIEAACNENLRIIIEKGHLRDTIQIRMIERRDGMVKTNERIINIIAPDTNIFCHGLLAARSIQDMRKELCDARNER
jgi:hypothetical protein